MIKDKIERMLKYLDYETYTFKYGCHNYDITLGRDNIIMYSDYMKLNDLFVFTSYSDPNIETGLEWAHGKLYELCIMKMNREQAMSELSLKLGINEL